MRRALRSAAFACSLACAFARAAGLGVVPQPASMAPGEGSFILTGATPIVVASGGREAAGVASLLAGWLRKSNGLALHVRNGKASDGAIVLALEPRADAPAESYRIEATRTRVELHAATRAGLFRAATTLWQMVPPGRAPLAVPAAHGEDAPRLSWRGVMLDSARQYQSPRFIRRFIDAMALEKLNVLHWHLTDDQAWRLEIRKYPRLTSVGAWRVPAGRAAQRDIDPATGKPRLYGGFYSQATVRSLVAYATAREVTIVPEIEMPGHATAALVAYPRLAASAADVPKAVSSDWGIFPNAYSLEPSTFEFLENVLTEVMALFPSRYIHVGGDEVQKGEWLASARGQALLREMGTTDPERLQAYFTQRIARFLEAHGRRPVGWDEILAPGLPQGAVVMSWRGIQGAEHAARDGYDAVVAAHPTFYFDNRQSASASEPPGRGRVVSLEDVYAFEPVPATLSAAQAAHVLGVEGNVWTEHIRTEERVGWMTFPRAAAIAELGWSQPASRDIAAFRERLAAQRWRLDAIGMTYARSTFEPPAPRGDAKLHSQELALCSDDIALSLEDDAPVKGPRATFLVDIENPCWIARRVDLDKVHALTAAVGQVPFNFQIGDDVKKIHFPAPTVSEGELQVRLDNCESAPVASIDIDVARASDAVTVLASVPLAGHGVHDVCLRFAQAKLDPMWVIDWIRMEARP
jgi:hexosaminidase